MTSQLDQSRPPPNFREAATEVTRHVPADRLAWGVWNHQTGKDEGEGDLQKSYSADKIGMGQPIRTPFEFSGNLWCAVSIHSRNGEDEIEAYRLTPRELYKGPVTTYQEKVDIDGGNTARNDALGFYSGMLVTHGKREYVMTGPKGVFAAEAEPQRPEEPAQMSLWEAVP